MYEAEASRRWMRIIFDLITALLGLQFIAGMLLNTYVVLPTYTAQDIMLALFSNPLLIVHAVVGVVTFLLALVALALSLKHRWPGLVLMLNAFLALSILAAGIAGLEFLLSEQPIFSITMAFFWLVSFAFVGFGQSSMRSENLRQNIKNA